MNENAVLTPFFTSLSKLVSVVGVTLVGGEDFRVEGVLLHELEVPSQMPPGCRFPLRENEQKLRVVRRFGEVLD